MPTGQGLMDAWGQIIGQAGGPAPAPGLTAYGGDDDDWGEGGYTDESDD